MAKNVTEYSADSSSLASAKASWWNPSTWDKRAPDLGLQVWGCCSASCRSLPHGSWPPPHPIHHLREASAPHLSFTAGKVKNLPWAQNVSLPKGAVPSQTGEGGQHAQWGRRAGTSRVSNSQLLDRLWPQSCRSAWGLGFGVCCCGPVAPPGFLAAGWGSRAWQLHPGTWWGPSTAPTAPLAGCCPRGVLLLLARAAGRTWDWLPGFSDSRKIAWKMQHGKAGIFNSGLAARSRSFDSMQIRVTH